MLAWGVSTPLLDTPISSRPLKVKKGNNEAGAQKKRIQERKRKQVLLKPQHLARKTKRKGRKQGGREEKGQ